MIFNETIAGEIAGRYSTDQGKYVACRQEQLIRRLIPPGGYERLLFVGVTTGESLAPFIKPGYSTTALVPAPSLMEAAERKIGPRLECRVGPAEDLPFSDNEFDLVVLLAALEFAREPRRVIDEAIRVCRDRLFIGATNRYAPFFALGNNPSLFPPVLHRQARSFYVGELLSLVNRRLSSVNISWGSHIFFPYGMGKNMTAIEEHIPLMKNPFGAFLGLSFEVSYRYRTMQDVIVTDHLQFKEKGRKPAQGLVRELE